MIISVAGGKGGTGKTTVATCLAAVLGERAQLLDCDVEEPNCHIFMKPVFSDRQTVGVPVPVIDTTKCTACGKCGEVCRFSAVLVLAGQVLTFPELCHGCGGCSLLCPEHAVEETIRELGVVESGFAGPVEFVHGVLRVGEAMSPPLVRAVKSGINPEKIAVLDAPPGSSCPVMNTVTGSDYIIMVTEPTPFGLNDLRIVVDAVSHLGIPIGVVLNRADLGDREVQAYCSEKQLPLLAQIPHDRRIAEGYSRGELPITVAPEYAGLFEEIIRSIEKTVGGRLSEKRFAVS